ncbi:MAG: glycosyltransferase [Alteromonadaceae bacterium]|nr:glycosyltransferase [Alteromonadaceae bacterium]
MSDPRGFLNNVFLKIGRKFGLQEKLGIRTLLSQNLSPLELVERNGQFEPPDSSESTLKSQGLHKVLDQLALKRIERTEKRLNLRVVPSVPRDFGPSKENVLVFLTSSLPYTNSGYSLRSHNLYSALASQANVNVIAMTRYGYPWVIGHAVRNAIDVVDNLKYVRILPRVFSLNPKQAIDQAVESMVKLCKLNAITLIHTTTDFTNALVASRAAAELGIPWIYEVRGEPESTWLASVQGEAVGENQLPRYFEKMRAKEDEAIRAAWRVITLSEVSLSKLVARGHEESKCRVVPNGFQNQLLHIPKHRARLRKDNTISNGTVLIGVISSIVGYEGIDTLIRAIPLLPSTYEVVVVGAGEKLDSLKQLARNLDVDARILFTGAVPEVEAMDWYREIDVLCVPRIDSEVTRSVTPLKTLPASALGVPIVASDLPALREVTGGYAKFFEPENPVELAKTLLILDQSPIDLECARRWVESRTWNALGEKVAKIYTGA